MTGRQRAYGLAFVIAATTVLSVALYHRGWSSPSTTWAGGIGDAEEMIWFIGWVPQAVIHGHSGLLSNYAFYPQGVNLMWNTSILLPALVLAPLTLLAGPVVSYNVLITIAPVAAAGTAYVAFGRWVSSRLAAAVAAIVFGFSPFLVLQARLHQQLSLLALLPVVALLVDEVLVRQRWRWWFAGGVLGFVAAAQLMIGEEMLTIEVLGAVVAAAALAARYPQRVAAQLPHALHCAAAAIAVFAVLAAYPLAVQFHGPRAVHGTVHQADFLPSNLQNFIQPAGQLINPNIVPPPHTWELLEPNAYIGIPLLAVVVIAVVWGWRRRRVVPVAAALFVVFAVCSLGSTLHSGAFSGGWLPWSVVARLPILGQVIPGRLPIVVDFAATLLLAVFIDLAVTDLRSWLPRVAAAVLTAAVIASWIPGKPLVTTVRTPRFFTTQAERRIPAGSVVVLSPYVNGFFTSTGLVWQAVGGMRFRMPEGFFIVPTSHNGPSTPASADLLRLQAGPLAATPARRSAFRNYLIAAGVDFVLVGPSRGESRIDKFVTAALGHSAFRAGGVSVWRTPRS